MKKVLRSFGARSTSKSAWPAPISGRRRLELDPGLAPAAVEAGVGERDGVGLDLGRVRLAAARALGAAHLEDVGEVSGVIDLQVEAPRQDVVVAERQPLEGAGVPKEPGAADVQDILGHRATCRWDRRSRGWSGRRPAPRYRRGRWS